VADPCGSFENCKEYSTALLDHFVQTTDSIAAQFARDRASKSVIEAVSNFQGTAREELRKMNALQVVVGAGGDVRQVHPNDWLRLGAELQKQDRYLERFAHEIRDGDMSEAAIASRLALYARSTQASFYREAAPVDLPAHPRDGSTPCLSNCDCEWRFDFEYDEDGNVIAVLATWVLGSTEKHCDVCPQRASDWNPLRIELV
jgi:hypothetical protein